MRAASTSKAATPLPLVLIVDDNLDAREMYAMCLEHAGFRAVEASDGSAAMEQVKRERPAVILMDATMPVLNGWEAARLLKGDADTQAIPLIMLTAHAFQEHRDRAAAIGADACLAKPVLPDELSVKSAASFGTPDPSQLGWYALCEYG